MTDDAQSYCACNRFPVEQICRLIRLPHLCTHCLLEYRYVQIPIIGKYLDEDSSPLIQRKLPGNLKILIVIQAF